MQAGSVLYNLAEVYRYIQSYMKIAFIIICYDGDDDSVLLLSSILLLF